MNQARTMQRVAHTIDNIGGRDLPHLAVHLEDAAKAPTLQQAKEHIGRAQGHVKEAVNQSGLLSEAIKTVPGVLGEARRLEQVRRQSDGLVNTKGKNMAQLKHTGTTNGKSNKLGGGGRFQQLVNQGKSPALAAYIGRRKYGAKAMAKMSAKGRS